MYNAQEARELSIINRHKRELFADIESSVQYAIQNGDTDCKLTIDESTPSDIVSDVIAMLLGDGYEARDYIDDGKWYLEISWEE